MRSYLLLPIIQFLCCPIMVSAEQVEPVVEWRQVFSDDFERARLGEMYEVKAGRAAVIAGRLQISGEDAVVHLTLAVPRDIRVEFDVTPLPDSPLGGVGCMLWSGSGAHYTLTFGANGNMSNTLIGPGLEIVDQQPAVLLEPGRRYRLTAQREGKRITCQIDGTIILDGTLTEIIKPAGIQRVVLTAEHGMLVDNFNVSSRIPAHPDCCPPPLPWLPLTRKGRTVSANPGFRAVGIDEAVAALNAKRFEEARERFEAIDDITIKLTGLAFILGDPDYYEKPMYGDLIDRKAQRKEYGPREIAEYFGEFGAFAARWRAEAQRHPDNKILSAYLPYVEHFGRLSLNRWSGPGHADELLGLDDRINPFVHKARLYEARFTYWNGMEGANETLKGQARKTMAGLLRLYPDNRILREYVGEPVPWGEELIADTTGHPAWAAYLREAYARELAIIDRLCEMRQRPDGQFGGGYGDDVEMLRRIVPIAAISSCSEKIRAGIERLSEGVWRYVCKDGYDAGIGDVEHSAEPTADSFPTMMLLRYGDPRYHEFNLRSCKTIREQFMGIDQRGYPRFYSSVFGVAGVHRNTGGDTGYHARAMKHFLWLAWYGNHEAKDWYLRWLDGWRDVAVTDAPDKPAGVLPGTLWYPGGSWQLPHSSSPWYADDRPHTYGSWGLGGMLQESFLAAFGLTGDEKFLRPIQLMMDWATLGPLQRDSERDKLPAGSRDWFKLPMAHMASARITALYRQLTGERVYDEYTMRFGTAPQVYQIDHNLDRMLKGIEAAARSLRNNLWYYTTETLSTDRLHLPAVESVWGAYTGAITTTGDCELPTFAVTYDTPNADFAALVVDNTAKRLRVWLYSFWDQPTTINLRVWQLMPGKYVLNQGEKVAGEYPFQSRYKWIDSQHVSILHRAEAIPVTVPPKTEYVVDLRLDQPIAVPPSACDLGVMPRDIVVQGRRLTVTIHNTGTAAAESLSVALQRQEADGWRTLGTQAVARLSQPVNLSPFTEMVSFDVPGFDLDARYRFVLDPKDTLYEICETNNIAEVPPDKPGAPASRPAVEDSTATDLPRTLSLDLGGDLKIELVLIMPGEFMMGLPHNEPRAGAHERPAHRVRIDKPFYIGKYEITQAQWERVSRTKPSYSKGDPNLPVEMVNWVMADEFCRRLTNRVWRSVRLPSEAEWEYACRAGSTTYWSYGDDTERLVDYAWFGRNAGNRTHPVGQKKPNAWGLYDMHGNVREWCGDWFEPYPGTKASPQEFADPRQRILRGSSWDWIEPENQGSARRDHARPDQRMNHYGLRIVVPGEAVSPAAR